jgi:LmbE family N-acetylglucosaminyl deacetylase
MLELAPGRRPGSALRVLCLGAHSDDIEIGCGGTMLRLLEERPGTEVRWVVVGAQGDRAREARDSAARFLAKAARSEVLVEGFRDSYFPYVGEKIKAFVESTRLGFDPDVVLTHCRGDLHQDHRLVSELTWNAYRDHLILEYEIPKYDGDLGQPNVFVPLPERVVREKARLVLEGFPSQRAKPWFSEDTFMALPRLRGVECNAPERYAEAFHGRKLRCGFSAPP